MRLRRFSCAAIKVRALAKTIPHDRLHASARYRFRVEARLRIVDKKPQADARVALRRMRAGMVAGTFEFT